MRKEKTKGPGDSAVYAFLRYALALPKNFKIEILEVLQVLQEFLYNLPYCKQE